MEWHRPVLDAWEAQQEGMMAQRAADKRAIHAVEADTPEPESGAPYLDSLTAEDRARIEAAGYDSEEYADAFIAYCAKYDVKMTRHEMSTRGILGWSDYSIMTSFEWWLNHGYEHNQQPEAAPAPPTHVTPAELARWRKVNARMKGAAEALQRSQQATQQALNAAIAVEGQFNLVAEELREAYGLVDIDIETGAITAVPKAGA